MPAHLSKFPEHPLKRLFVYAAAFRAKIFGAAVCSVLNKLFDIAPEILIGVAIDVVVNKQDSFLSRFGVHGVINQIYALGILTFFVWFFESLFEYLLLMQWRDLAQEIQHAIRMEAYDHVQKLDMAYFEDRSTGNLVSILNDDANQLERFLNGGANSLIQTLTTVVAVGAVFFYISPFIAVVAFTPIPVIIWGAFYFQRRAQPLYASVRDRVGDLSQTLSNNILGIATIKSFTAEKREYERLETLSRTYCDSNRKAIRLSSAFIPVIRMAILAGFLGTLIFGARRTLSGELGVGSYGVLVFLTQRLLWPLTGLAETVDLFERAMASVRRLLDLLKTPIHISSSVSSVASGTADIAVRGEIRFENVDFSYGTGPALLQNLNLAIGAGESIGLVGLTGSGKSTLIKLLLRFYEPLVGRILLDGRALDTYSLSDLRGQIGLVSQDVYLFPGSVKENIEVGKPGAGRDEVRRAAAIAEAVGFVERLAQKFDTVVGERGQKLSGGQRQRISIARAVIKDPPIMIFDEATSSVDNETEALIQRSLKEISKNRTTIIVAHRLSTVVDCDRIVVLDRGKIAEHGRHAELLLKKGLYAGLWDVQTGSHEKNPIEERLRDL